MIEQNSKIRKGAPAIDPRCFQAQADIVIPAGTILRSSGKDEFSAEIGIPGLPRQSLILKLHMPPGTPAVPALKAVIA